MRARARAPGLLACAALAFAALAAASRPPASHPAHTQPEPARLIHIKTQILAKLGLSGRPRAAGAPPRSVVRAILARAADPPHAHAPEPEPEPESSMREIIAIAHRGHLAPHANATMMIPRVINPDASLK